MKRRRLLATKRKEREESRIGFLNELIAKKTEADQLRSWLVTNSFGATGEIEPNLTRMIQWVEARLFEIDQFLSDASISQWLEQNELFPEMDELLDPKGDPPEQFGYY